MGWNAFARRTHWREDREGSLRPEDCREQVKPDQGFVIVTSRCSFELVEKVAAFGARTLIAISAPTSLALERARHLDIALVGIARRDTMTVFHGLERIRAQDALA